MSNMIAGVDVSNPRNVISKVFFDGIKNLILFGIAALVIALIMNGLGWRTFGFILACIFAIPIAINLVKFIIFDVLLAILGLLIAIKEKIRGESDVIKKEPMLLLGNIICLIENSVSVVYVTYFYHAYYQKDLFGILGKLGIL